MNRIKLVITALLGLLASLPAFGQLEVRVEPLRRDYILGENVRMRIMVTNHTDAPTSLVSTPGRPWLYMHIARRGDSSPSGAGGFSPLPQFDDSSRGA